jgi:hypothetical protein
VSTVVGFLWMNQEELGFDPTIITADGRRYIEVEWNSQRERLIIDEVMKRAPCKAGRATTCWKSPPRKRMQGHQLRREDGGRIFQESEEFSYLFVALCLVCPRFWIPALDATLGGWFL